MNTSRGKNTKHINKPKKNTIVTADKKKKREKTTGEGQIQKK